MLATLARNGDVLLRIRRADRLYAHLAGRLMDASMSQGQRAPAGYTRERPLVIQGHAYVGGEWIPGQVLAVATPAERARAGLPASPPTGIIEPARAKAAPQAAQAAPAAPAAKPAVPVAKPAAQAAPAAKPAVPAAPPTPATPPAERLRQHPPAERLHLDSARSKFSEFVKGSSVSDAKKKEYENYGHHVLGVMTPTALRRFVEYSAGATFYDTNDALNKALAARSKKARDLIASGKRIGGCYNFMTMKFDLDGNRKSINANESREVYAHEFTHAVDGPRQEFSNSQEWQEAWRAEIASGQLTEYATITAAEGFAEFGRLAYGRSVHPDALRKKYPKATAVWEKHGLLPQTGRSTDIKLQEKFDKPIYDGHQHIDPLLPRPAAAKPGA